MEAAAARQGKGNASTRSRWARRRKLRLRKWPLRLLLLVPGASILAIDLSRRSAQIQNYSGSALHAYLESVALSVVMWAALIAAGATRRGWERWCARILVVVIAALAVGAQAYFFHRYQAYMNERAVLVGTSMLPSVGQQLWSDRFGFLRAIVPPLLLALALPLAVARLAPLQRRGALCALDIATCALLVTVFCASPSEGGEQGAMPDVLYLSSMGKLAEAHWDESPGILRAHPSARTPLPVPTLTGRSSRRAPNVLFIVTESVRAAEVCADSRSAVPPGAGQDPGSHPPCATTPFSDAAAPNRFSFRQMRSLDSTTAVSLAVLWSGVPATATREQFHTAPLLWEYARAAHFATAYWTSQNLFFANAGLWLEGVPLTRTVNATQLEQEATYETGADDGRLVDVVLRDLAQVDSPDAVASASPPLTEPFVGVVHLSNTHFPYKIDPADAPFQPESEAVGAGDQAEVLNRYRDAIYLQDKHVGRLLRELRASAIGARTVVVYVSDHGEQIRERGAVGHTDNVQDEEIRTPAWLDAPPGLLTARDEEQLRALRDMPLTQLDVLPTLLDVMGIDDSPQLATLRASLPGTSLLRGGTPPERGVVLTNCTEIFACAFKNWGAMRGTKKLVATQNDFAWRCYDVSTDPDELEDLGEAGCPGLRALAEGDGRGAPF